MGSPPVQLPYFWRLCTCTFVAQFMRIADRPFAAKSSCSLRQRRQCSNMSTYASRYLMTVTTLSSREFNQDTSRAKKAAQDGPVFITDRGRPAHVLLTMQEYQRLTGGQMTLIEALAQPDAEDVDFDPPRVKELHRPADLS